MKWTTETGETRYLAVHALPAWGGGSQCDPADLIAALQANPEAAGQVLLALESQYIAGEMAKSQARAEQAEYSLAASERALAALRYQVEAGGCELSTVGEDSYHCRADAPCGLCRLRHRASQAERSLATLRELIHTASGLDDHRYSAEQMVKEMAERWQGASDDCEKAEQALATVTGERDEARAERDAAVDRLVGARVARESAIEDAEALRAQLAKTEAVVEALPRCGHRFGCARRSTRSDGYTAFCDEHGGNWPLLPWHAALRALDADTGGGTSQPAGVAALDPEAPATRAEVEELRRRVERLENLTGSGSG